MRSELAIIRMHNNFLLMASSSEKILLLRKLLVDHVDCRKPEEAYPTGLPSLDEVGIPQGALTEIVSSPAYGPGGGLLVYGLLHASIRKGERVMLIDGKMAFVPNGLAQTELNRLLWTQCRKASEAVKAADLAVRDGNVPLVMVLLTQNPPGELQRIPANAWHRLQMLAEKSAVTLLVFTPMAHIGCARLRLSVGGLFSLDKLHGRRDEWLPSLALRVERRRVGTNRDWNEELRRTVCA